MVMVAQEPDLVLRNNNPKILKKRGHFWQKIWKNEENLEKNKNPKILEKRDYFWQKIWKNEEKLSNDLLIWEK